MKLIFKEINKHKFIKHWGSVDLYDKLCQFN